jgi:hypothetical protein
MWPQLQPQQGRRSHQGERARPGPQNFHQSVEPGWPERVARGGSRIELVHQRLSVRLDPALYSLARLHPEDLYPRRSTKSTAGGSAHELALVRPSILVLLTKIEGQRGRGEPRWLGQFRTDVSTGIRRAHKSEHARRIYGVDKFPGVLRGRCGRDIRGEHYESIVARGCNSLDSS